MLEDAKISERSVTVRISAVDSFSSVVQRYNQAMGQAENATRRLGQETDRSASDLDRLGTAVTGMIAAWGLMGVKNFAEDMNALGVQVNATRRIFGQLASELGEPAESLEKLRKATLGVVDDMTLMGGANQFLRMNLATTSDELAKLTEIAIKLKRPTVDATTAVQDFALLLSQQSILRLDNFGFSAGRVRQRINELLASGEALNRSEAFNMTVLEEGELLLKRYGSAADVAGTALGRLQTNIANFTQEFAGRFAMGVEGGIGILEISLGLRPEQVAATEARAQAAIEDLGAVLTYAFNDPAFKDQLPLDFMQNFVSEALKVAQESPELMSDMNTFTHTVLNRIGQGMPTGAEGLPEFQLSRTLAEATVQIQAGNQARRDSIRLTEQAAIAELDRLAILEEEANLAKLEGERAQLRGAIGGDLFGLEAQLAQTGAVPRGFMDLLEGDFTMPRFIDSQQAQQFHDIAEEADRLLDDATRFDELDPELFSDDQLEMMKDVASETEKLAKEADKAAGSFDKIKLTELFGQGPRGAVESLTGQVGGMVAEQMRASGAPEEQVSAFQQEYGLLSNEITPGSIALEEQIAPMIAQIEAAAPGMGAMAVQQVAQILAESVKRGIDPNSPEFWAAVRESLGVTPGSSGAGFSVYPGDTVSGLAGQYGMTPEEIMAAAGITNPRLLQPGQYSTPGAEVDTSALTGFDPETFFADFETMSGQAETFQTSFNTFLTDAQNAVPPVGDIELSMGNISSYATTLSDKMAALTSKVQEVTVKIKVEYDDARGWLEQTVRNNGGTVPGTTPGGGPS